MSKKVTVTLTESQIQRLDDLAKKRKVSRSTIIREIIDSRT